jgi:hypothetical protein
MPYKTWTTIDSGREGLWDLDVWLGVIKLVAKYDGENVYDEHGAIYAELDALFPGKGWKKHELNSAGVSEFRPLFRDYPKPWTTTGTVRFDDQTFRITDQGRRLISGEIGPSDVFVKLLNEWEEGDERPFQILARAIIEYAQPLSFEDFYRGVMLGYRPGDDINKAIAEGRISGLAIEKTPERRLRHLLNLLDLAGCTKKVGDKWIAWNLGLLRQISNLPRSTKSSSKLTIANLAENFAADLKKSGLRISRSVIIRLSASLLAKRFVILTGLSGSGKSKLAEACAAWLCAGNRTSDPFALGNVVESDRKSYRVTASDKGAVEFSNSPEAGEGTLVTLPRNVIQEWTDYIASNNLSRDVSCREIREAVAPKSKYSSQIHSFETHLKAAAFALLESSKKTFIGSSYVLVSVGADWTSNENVLGYQDALSPDRYRKPTSGVLDLILTAEKDPGKPYFLILDEMNLSHVERYFSDILSAIESKQPIALHSSDKELPAFENDPYPVPSRLKLPPNLFIIGTVNVDETTYMFSPKVLDRANVVEFRVAKDEMAGFLGAPKAVDMESLAGGGAAFGEAFIAAATSGDVSAGAIPEAIRGAADVAKDLNDSLLAAFDGLAEIGAEFGYRTAYEISRFIYFHAALSGAGWQFKDALDAQVFQKLLPKLHGSERRLGPVLEKLEKFCTEKNLELSLEKIKRMRERLKDGFTSFAEA